MTTPDPQPDEVPGLEPGGGVPPGETPPGEAATSGNSHQEAPRGTVITPVALVAIGVIVLAVIGFLIAKVVALP